MPEEQGGFRHFSQVLSALAKQASGVVGYDMAQHKRKARSVAAFDEITWMSRFNLEGNFRSISFFVFFFPSNVADL